MYDFPIKYYENNLIFNNERKECWAAFKMIGYNYDYKSIAGKKTILNSLARFISNIGKEAAIFIVPISQDINKHYDNLIYNLDKKDSMYVQAKSHALQTQAYLEEKIRRKENANDYKVYVLTKINISTSVFTDVKDAVKYFITDPMQTINEIVGTEYKDIYEKDIEMFLKLSNEFLRKQNRRIALNKCDEYDIEWLIKRTFYRGIGEFMCYGDSNKNAIERNKKILKIKKDNVNEDELEELGEHNEFWTPFSEQVLKNGEKAIRCAQREMLKLTEGIIDLSEKRCVTIRHDDKVSYQTFLAVANIPDGILFPGHEWLLALQDYPMQTEVIIRISTVEHKESLSNIDKKKKEIDDQIEHTIDSEEELPEELSNSRAYARELEAELKASKSPMSEVSITFCLSADSKEKLESRVDFIKEIFTDNNFVLERPITDQMKLFMESIPGTPRYVRDYIQRIPPRTLAGGIIGATRQIGDNVGPYIGTTGELEKSVYLELARACRLNRSASCGFYGTLGGGKSFAADTLFYLSVLYGGLGLVIDPKGDRTDWDKDLPEFKGKVNIITLSADEKDRGKLDPFIIYKDDLANAEYLALSILSELFKLNPKDDEYIAALSAIRWVKKQEKPCMMKMADRLLNWDDEDEYLAVPAKRLGIKIKYLHDMAMAGLLFGEGDEEALDLKRKINVLQIQNLQMPDPKKPKDEYNQEELLSTVLMIPIASFARKFIHQDRKIFKVILFDEAWALNATSAGKQMMNALIREGRSLFAGCLFISQGTSDVDVEGVKTNISYKFCFKATDLDEIKSVLKFLDLEDTDENIDAVKNLENGECLFQDLDGRVGKLKFDAVFEHLIKKAFNTNPDKVKNEGEKDEKG